MAGHDGAGGPFEEGVTSLHRRFSVERINIPLLIACGAATALLTLAASYWKLQSHSEQWNVHLDPREVIQGGGVAYKGDLREVAQKCERALADERLKMLRLWGGMELECRKTPKGQKCTVLFPKLELE